MKTPLLIVSALVAPRAGPAIAHHGWGSYDAANPITVTGPIVTSKFENPHATHHGARQRQGVDGDARADLAHDQPRRHAAVVAVGNTVSAFGYRSTAEQDEMRAERITVNGKTYEMR